MLWNVCVHTYTHTHMCHIKLSIYLCNFGVTLIIDFDDWTTCRYIHTPLLRYSRNFTPSWLQFYPFKCKSFVWLAWSQTGEASQTCENCTYTHTHTHCHHSIITHVEVFVSHYFSIRVAKWSRLLGAFRHMCRSTLIHQHLRRQKAYI